MCRRCARLDPGRYCSPRHMMPLNSINEGLNEVGDVVSYRLADVVHRVT